METQLKATPKKSARRMAGPPSVELRDLRHVYSHPESMDDKYSQQLFRAILKQNPLFFLKLLVRLEAEHLARG